MKKIMTLIIGLVLSGGVFAAQQYQVEMIIFSQINAKGLNSETWPPIPAFQLPNTDYISLNGSQQQAADTDSNFELLPPWQLKLNDVAKRLNANPNYQTLLHIGWIEAVPDPSEAKPIYITNATNSGPIDVQGVMSLNVDRYFNAYLNLTFTVPANQLSQYNDDQFDTMLGSSTRFHLLQSRRFRSNELNYIDNPLFGVLLEVFPVKS